MLQSSPFQASELSAGELAELREEEAMEKAAEGDFIADVNIVCAFGLPKVRAAPSALKLLHVIYS